MTADRESSFVLKFDGDAGTLSSVLSSLKSQIKSDVAEIERTAGKVELFKGLQEQLATTRANFDASKAKADELAASININLGGASKELKAQLAAATKEMVNAEKAAAKTQAQIDRLAGQLKLAGVNTRDLEGEQARLAAALKQAQTAAANQAAQQTLGVRTLRDIAPEINRLQLAYNQLARAGKLSSDELALAHTQLRTKIAELRASVTGVAGAAKDGAPTLAGFFSGPLLPALGLTASVAGLLAGIKSAVSAANEFTEGVAQIGTVTNLSRAQLDALGQGARDLAKELAIDVNGAVKGLFELIRSGVPPENALEVLRVSAEAAKAALTDTGTGVKAANILIDGFGASLDQLPTLFDKIIAGAHNGGATLKEFADNAGGLVAVAKAAGESFDDMLAVLTVMVDKSGNAEKSIGDLTKIIAKIDTAEARAKLRDLGITGDSLVDIFRQIGARGLALEDVLGLGLSASGGKAAASLAALTNGSKDLPETLDAITKSAGATQESLGKIEQTDSEKIKQLGAAFDDLKIAFGLLVAGATPAIRALTSLFNALAKPSPLMKALADATGKVKSELPGVQPAAQSAAAGMQSAATAAGALGARVEDAAARARRASADLTDFATRLSADVKALQDALTRDVGDINARAEAEIAALDRSRTAQAATSQATLEIQLKAAADRLAAITKSEADITAAVDKETAARTALARKQGIDEQKIATDTATARIAALQPVLAQYQTHYNTLIALSQTYAQKARDAEQARVDIVKAVTEEIRQTRLGELDGLDQFVEKQKHIDELISEGRRKAAEGDVESAKQFFDQAIAESKGLTEVVDQNGVKVITNLQAREARLDALKKISDAANESIGAQGAAAAKGANESLRAAESVSAKLKELQGQYDGLKATIAEGLKARLDLDQGSVKSALATLDELTKPRTVVVTVVTRNTGGESVPLPSSGNTGDNTSGGFQRGGLVRQFARGGPVQPIRRYAFGGPVFAGKVPGTGSGDIFPAPLQAGSFVVRKRASRHYGDALMRRVVRGYAIGGIATNILKPGGIAERFLSPKGLAERLGLGGPSPLSADLKALEAKLQRLRDLALGLRPAPAGEVSIGDWAALAMQRLPLMPSDRVSKLKEVVDASFDGWVSGIEQARRFGVPSVIEFPLLTLLRRGGLAREQPTMPRFAAGGSSRDTVPAMLEPGEWVSRRKAVQKYGVDFFARLNRMEIPKVDLAAMFAPPARIARFADGGLVGGSAPASRGASAGPAGQLTVNINAAAGDLFSPGNVRRFIVPVLQDLMRLGK